VYVGSSEWSTAEAPFMTRVAGKYYCEMEVLEPEGEVVVGFAGTMSEKALVGQDAASWGINEKGEMVTG
jgi:hypothetical protein